MPERPAPRLTVADERGTTASELLDACQRPPWHAEAACRGRRSEIDFFPVRGVATRAAKVLCAGCAVRAACLDFALSAPADLNGVWGGTVMRDRRILRRERRLGAA